MAIDVVMPQMGESIAEGTVVRWIKKPGDKVERDAGKKLGDAPSQANVKHCPAKLGRTPCFEAHVRPQGEGGGTGTEDYEEDGDRQCAGHARSRLGA